ncbi:hypothetical protein V1512DRAFT_226858 [Lipomyces arxii]|uniref:uncharacterized protein n=1 Tax=Lipomyces arxii TaxID=56418 RepID=UPI0034CE1220
MSKREKLKLKNNPRGFLNKHDKNDKYKNSKYGPYTEDSNYIDVSSIYDPQLVIIFKGLQKRDPTTKEKALEHLATFLADPESDVDEGVLAVWVQVYPQLAIEYSRRLRVLAHKIQGDMFKRFQRHSAKYMKESAGPWLGGFYDNDKLVARSAITAFENVFAGEERQQQVFQVFHAQLLEYVRLVIASKATHDSSDEKYFSQAEIESKVTREIAKGISLFSYLLANIPPESIVEQQYVYAEIITSDKLWTSITSPDAHLSRVALSLIVQLAYNYNAWLNAMPHYLGQYLISNGLINISVGAISDYLDCLVTITRLYPASWTPSTETNEPSLSLLLAFVAEGSRFAGPKFWHYVDMLIENLPSFALNLETPFPMDEISNAFRAGLLLENRMSIDAGIDAYISLLGYLTTATESSEIQNQALEKTIEIAVQYLVPSTALGKKIGTEGVARSLTNYYRRVCTENMVLASQFWSKTVEIMTENVQNRSKEDESVALGVVTRWILFVKRLASVHDESSQPEIAHDVCSVVQIALKAAKGGSVPVYALKSVAKELFAVIKADATTLEMVAEFMTNEVPGLVMSKSGQYLIDAWVLYERAIADPGHAAEMFRSLVTAIVHSPSSTVDNEDASEDRESMMVYLLQSIKPIESSLKSVDELEQFVLSHVDSGKSNLDLLVPCLCASGHLISESVGLELLSKLVQFSELESGDDQVFEVLLPISQRNFGMLKAFIKTDEGARLASRLWQLTESGEQSSPAAKSLRQKLEGQLSIVQSSQDGDSLFDSLAGAVRRDVETDFEVELDNVAGRSVSLWESAKTEGATAAAKLLFVNEWWTESVCELMKSRVPLSVALVNNIGGAMCLVAGESDGVDVSSVRTRLLRKTAYAFKLIEYTTVFESLEYVDQVELFVNLQLISELAKDVVNEYGASKMPALFGDENGGSDELLNIIEGAATLMRDKIGMFDLTSLGVDIFEPSTSETQNEFARDVILALSTHTCKNSVRGFYSARVLAGTITLLSESVGFTLKQAESLFDQLNLRRTKNVLGSIAVFEGLSRFISTMSTVSRFRNELASDILGLRPANTATVGLQKVVLLNSLLRNVDDGDFVAFPTQRAVMLLKRLLDMVPDTPVYEHIALRAEVTQLILYVLPAVKSLYGDHWFKVLDSVSTSLVICAEHADDDDVVTLGYYALRVVGAMRVLQDENEDVADAVAEDTTVSAALIQILVASVNVSHRSDARLLCDAALSRHVLDIPVGKIDDPAALYEVLAVDSEPLQKAVVRLEAKIIPVAQEALTVEAALDVHGVLNIEVPGELLSLVMSAPDDPSGVRGYFYAWVLIFEHFDNAPFALKTRYVESLKNGDFIDGMLRSVTDVLGLAGKAVDVKPGFAVFDTETAYDSVVDEARALGTFVFYRSLRHVPSLVRRWWSEIRNRQLSLGFESFVQKHFSPVLIDAEFKSVQTRLAEDELAEDENMVVKVTRASREVSAIYTVDDQALEMTIRAPGSYPLHDVTVDGVKRVGVKENQWRAWLLASQAVIVAQNGSIVDAVALFRRNVSLHFEGVTECAICYSILHQDRSLPNKKCQTCKHKFHAGCLYKWFQSSNSSTCPLCRQPFTFGR